MAVTQVTIDTVGDQVQTGFDLVADFALQSIPIFDQFTTVKTADTNQGDSITFHRWADLGETVTPIDEVTDVSPVALNSSAFSVSGAEYGSVTVTTAKLRSVTMLPGFSKDQVTLVARTMAFSVDTLARTEMETSTTKTYIGQATEGAILAGDILSADEVRQQHAAAVTANIQPLGSDFIWVIHPHKAYDLKSETGDGAFIAPAQYVNTDKVYNNEIGKFAGFKFVESNRCLINADGGDTNVDTYTSYVFGADAVAKAVWTPPGLVQGPVTDYLKRLVPLGWYGYLGYGLFREEAMRLVVGASSMGAN